MTVPAAARHSESSAERLVAVADRFLPLVWIGLYLLLPVSGRSGYAFEAWNDQIRDLEALRALLDGGSSLAMDLDRIGPAYVGAAALIHLASGLSPEDSLVWLSRGSYALSVAAGMLLVRRLVQRLTLAGPHVSLGAQAAFCALAFSAWTWHWSDFPWSHFLAAFLGVAFYAARFVPAGPSLATAGLAGAVLALLALTRTFELVAILAAWGVVAALATAAGLRARSVRPSRSLLLGAAVFLAATAVVHAGTGKTDPFVYGSSDAGRLSGTLAEEELADTPALTVGLVHVKAAQLFVDPCFDSNCALDDYAGGPRSVFELWRMPLAIQLPALVLLPVALLACAGLAAWAVRRRPRPPAHAREISALLEMSIAAAAITFGYLASTLAGGAHLKYGLARDFMLPATLTAVVVAVLAVAGTWVVASRWRAARRWRREPLTLAVAGCACVGILVATSVGRSAGLPRVESRHLASIEYRAECGPTACDVSASGRAASGRERMLPPASTLTFGCGGDEPDRTLYVRRLVAPVEVPSCRDPRLVAAWPLVMGLPPTPEELYAVRVVNSTR